YGVLRSFARALDECGGRWSMTISSRTALSCAPPTAGGVGRTSRLAPASGCERLRRGRQRLDCRRAAGPRAAYLYRTVDGGRSWSKVGRLPRDCQQLDFVDARHDWCPLIGAAAGSAVVMPVPTRYRG